MRLYFFRFRCLGRFLKWNWDLRVLVARSGLAFVLRGVWASGLFNTPACCSNERTNDWMDALVIDYLCQHWRDWYRYRHDWPSGFFPSSYLLSFIHLIHFILARLVALVLVLVALVVETVILYYDFCLTFREEVEFFWHRRINSVTLLFFANRYLSLLGNVPVILQSFASWSPNVSG